jgi:hypothetical protein
MADKQAMRKKRFEQLLLFVKGAEKDAFVINIAGAASKNRMIAEHATHHCVESIYEEFVSSGDSQNEPIQPNPRRLKAKLENSNFEAKTTTLSDFALGSIGFVLQGNGIFEKFMDRNVNLLKMIDVISIEKTDEEEGRYNVAMLIQLMTPKNVATDIMKKVFPLTNEGTLKTSLEAASKDINTFFGVKEDEGPKPPTGTVPGPGTTTGPATGDVSALKNKIIDLENEKKAINITRTNAENAKNAVQLKVTFMEKGLDKLEDAKIIKTATRDLFSKAPPKTPKAITDFWNGAKLITSPSKFSMTKNLMFSYPKVLNCSEWISS